MFCAVLSSSGLRSYSHRVHVSIAGAKILRHKFLSLCLLHARAQLVFIYFFPGRMHLAAAFWYIYLRGYVFTEGDSAREIINATLIAVSRWGGHCARDVYIFINNTINCRICILYPGANMWKAEKNPAFWATVCKQPGWKLLKVLNKFRRVKNNLCL